MEHKKRKWGNPFASLTRFEWGLWIGSLIVVSASFLLVPERDFLTLMASLVGVTALIFVAKGHVIGQALCVVFALFYGIISFYFRYYGEMITYLGMSAPAAVFSVISWLRNPYRDSSEVKVNALTPAHFGIVCGITAVVTGIFYFLLRALNTANLTFSVLSVATSFLASSLTFLRSPWYAIAYAANDVVLIVLWVLAAIEEPSYLPMIFCFIMFLFNDGYGFYSWRRMKKRQFIESL